MENKVSAVLTNQDLTDIENFVTQIPAILTFVVTLEMSQRKSLRKMGNRRESYVNDVFDKVKNFMMQAADVGYALLKVAARNNASVKAAVKAVAENNKGMGRRPNSNIYEIAKSGSLIISACTKAAIK